MTKHISVLLSGGIESVTLFYEASTNLAGHKVTALILEAGVASDPFQIHYAKRHCLDKGSPYEIIDLRGIQKLMAGFVAPPLATMDEYDMKCPTDSALPVAINAAIFRCQLAKSDELWVGLTKEQERTNTRQYLAEIGRVSALYEDGFLPVAVVAPYLDITKAQVIQKGISLGVDYSATWSCFLGGQAHCGRCASCSDRKAAFQTAGLPDPTQYLS